MPAAAGSTASAASTASPTTTTLAMVPMPGRWRSGIHSSRIGMPSRITTQPKLIPVTRDRPWWNTSHGSSPRPDSIIRAMLTP
jgi:hypothetical protein